MKINQRAHSFGRFKWMGGPPAPREYPLSTTPAGYCGPGDGIGEILMIERLCDVWILENERIFLVKWMGYPEFKNTWEREKDLPRLAVKLFEQNMYVTAKIHSTNCFNNILLGSNIQGRRIIFVRYGKFPKGWIPEEIKCIIEGEHGRKRMIVEFKDHDELISVTYTYCKARIPQLVIKFFQNHLKP